MRKLPFYLFVLPALLYSCKKHNSGGGPAPSPYYLASATGTVPQRRIVDSFYYDTQHRVDTFTQYIYDTTSGSPKFNSWTIQFIYQDNNAWPSWYNYYDYSLGGYGEYHLLSYDANNRITKDTSLSGSGAVTWYTYPNGNMASTILPEGTPTNNFVDTCYISNGNVSKVVLYFAAIPGQPDVYGGGASFTVSPTANPAYHAADANTIGPILFNYTLDYDAGIVDFISKEVWQKVTSDAVLSPFGISELSYTMNDDSKGRIVKMSAGAASSPATITYSYY